MTDCLQEEEDMDTSYMAILLQDIHVFWVMPYVYSLSMANTSFN